MKHADRMVALGLMGIVTVGMTAAGCATPWFGNPKGNGEPSAPRSKDLKTAAATYINGLCKLPKEQRDPQIRELNEALLPNHANISCGPGT
jgi:hypothetical protein